MFNYEYKHLLNTFPKYATSCNFNALLVPFHNIVFASSSNSTSIPSSNANPCILKCQTHTKDINFTRKLIDKYCLYKCTQQLYTKSSAKQESKPRHSLKKYFYD